MENTPSYNALPQGPVDQKDKLRRELVRSALETLSAEQREVIELAYYSGLSHSEIALRLGQPLGTVKTRTRLGMMKLRDMLRPLLEGQI